MRVIGYVRMTITDNDPHEQAQTLNAYGCDTIFYEAAETNTKKNFVHSLESVIAQMQPGETITVCNLHRLGKTTRQLTELTQIFQKRGIHLVSINEQIDTRKPMGDVYFNLMHHLSEMESALIKERTLVGLKEARKKGKVGGRPKISKKKIREIHHLYHAKKQTIQIISSQCGVSVGTCYKYAQLSPDELETLLATH